MKKLYLMLLMGLVYPVFSYAQPADLVLSSAESGTQLHQATNSITFAAGYSYTPNGGTMTAEIVSGGSPAISDVVYLDPENLPAHDQSLSVGTIPGQAAVSSSGAATYTIPIEVPPAAQGMQPDLSLVYNSQTGNGIMGVGWNLAGLSSISRVPKNIYNDGKVEEIKLDATDNFALDGNRMLWDNRKNVYLTEIETFVKIIPQGSSDGGPLWFKVETKDGLTIEYGRTSDAIVNARNNLDGILSWKINKVYDNYGNYILYRWEEMRNPAYNTTVYDVQISEIAYGGNENESNELNNIIHFNYGKRADVTRTFYDDIGAYHNQFLLNSIEITNETGFIRSYALGYVNEGFSKLFSIKMMGSQGDCYNETFLKWRANPGSEPLSRFNFVPALPKLPALDTEWLLADVNGDSKFDLIFKTPSLNRWDLHIYLDQYEPDFDSIGSWSLDNVHQLFTADIDNDGQNSIFIVENMGGNHDVLQEYIYNPVSKQLSLVKTTDLISKYTTHVLFGDFDGDMEQDILAYDENRKIQGIILAKTGEILTVNHINNPKAIELIDSNGNGKTDVRVVDNSGNSQIFEYTGTTALTQLTENLYFLVGNDNCLKGDFDGDNRTDFLCFAEGIWKIYRTVPTHNGYSTDSEPLPLSNSAPSGLHHVFVSDFNNDGFDDILEIVETNPNPSEPLQVNKTFNYHYNYGNGRFHTVSWSEYNWVPDIDRKFILSDLNADGAVDIVDLHYFWVDQNRTKKSMTGYFYKSPFYQNNTIVESIRDGFNQTTKFDYHRLFFDKRENTTDVFFQFLNQPPVYIASGLSVGSETATLKNQSYSFLNPYLHKEGKGFLGFSTVEAHDNITGFTSKSTYQMVTEQIDFCMMAMTEPEASTSSGITTTLYHPLLSEVIISDSNSEIISKRTFDNRVRLPDPCLYLNYDNFFIYTRNLTEIDYLKNQTTVSNYIYDDYGNPETITVDYNGDAGTVTTNTYTSFSNWWCPKARLRQSTVKKTRPGETDFTSSTWFDYNSQGALTTKKSFYGQPKEVTQTYSDFDNFGNPWTASVAAAGLETRETLFEYDPYGRFVTKQTNPLLQATQFTYDGKTGNLLTQTDVNNLTTSYGYDGFGRSETISYPDGNTTGISRHWQIAGNTSWYEKELTGGQPEHRTYYDTFGRVLKEEEQGFDGSMIAVETTYNTQGWLSGTSEPYTGATASQWTSYVYKTDGRIDRVSYPNGVIETHFYNGSSTTVNSSTGVEKVTVTDGTGALVSAEDNGGAITYAYYASGNLKSITTPDGEEISMTYDEYGRHDLLTDPDAGTIDYGYNAFGELTAQTDAEGNDYTMQYDKLGRLDMKKLGTITVVDYTYDTAPNGVGLLALITGNDNVSYSYEYDNLSRLKKKTENIQGRSFDIETAYNSYSQVRQVIYPGTTRYTVDNQYQNGYLSTVKGTHLTTADIFAATAYNNRRQITNYSLGNGLATTREYDDYGFPTTIQTPGIQNLEYNFNTLTGNLDWRKDHMHTLGGVSLQEDFTYDNLMKNRLETWQVGSGIQYTANYDANGNIGSKTGLGTFYYQGIQPHAVTGVDNTEGVINLDEQNVSYTSFNKVRTIREGDYKLEIFYGPDNQRKKTILYRNANSPIPLKSTREVINWVVYKTKYFVGGIYEEEITDAIFDNIREINYIPGGDGLAAIFLKDLNQGEDLYYIHKDHLGSYQAISDESGALLEELSFDPWGNRRNPADWSFNNMPTDYLFDRGFTGHEHLDKFSLVNMNGRVYDPLLGRMLSPDNYIQAPDYTQNLNRYSYCFNNPLKYTDSTGNFGEGLLPWAYMLFGNYAINVADNVINKGMPFGKALRASTISVSANYSPSMNTISNYQVDAYTSAAHLVEYARDLDQEINGIRSSYYASSQGVDGVTGAAVNHGMPDMTGAFDRQLAETYYNFKYKALDATFADKMNTMLTYMSAGAPHDFKNRPSSVFHRDNMGEFGLYRGQKMAPDDFGNYNYGIAAKALGLPEWFSVGVVGFFPNSVRTWWNVAGGFDQIKDTRMIRSGYNHEW